MTNSQINLTETVQQTREAIATARRNGLTVALVPTMGALHAGHVRLIEAARRECDYVVVSIFVNPTQFGPNEDFTRYPRTPEDDAQRCVEGDASLIFSPSPETMYPRGQSSTWAEVPGLSDVLEGKSRPGHFRGVATVVLKLLNIVTPDVAFFGEKDFQQLLVIRRMVSDLNVPVQIHGVSTVRESDGLAMSSRNRYLNSVEREAATVLSQALNEAKAAVVAGEHVGDRVRQILRTRIESESQAKIDYVEIVDPETLQPLVDIAPPKQAIALLAVRVGPARLIDNLLLVG